MVATVVRYTGPFVRYSCTSSRSVASPPAIAGYTTRRTFSSGAASEASAIENRMFPLSVTFLKALISSAVTFFSARALLHIREREITDTLVELLIATVHRINARAEKKVTAELINAFKKVPDKENILFSIAEASLAAPEEKVRRVVYPAIAGGEATLRELVHEYRTKGPVYRTTVATTLRADSG